MARPGRMVCSNATPVLDTLIYASGDVLHTADLTFDNVVEEPAGTGLIKQCEVWDYDAQGVNLELWIFTRVLANTTHTANGAWNLADADLQYLVGVIPVSTWYASSNNKLGLSGTNLDMPFKCEDNSRKLYGVLVTRGTPTYTAAGLMVGLCVDRMV